MKLLRHAKHRHGKHHRRKDHRRKDPGGDVTSTGKADQTSRRLLNAAVEIFGARGYHAATIAAICEAADANIAAVSYYFDDKAGLYAATWEYAYDQAVAAMPYDEPGVDETPEERLFRNVRSLVYRMGGDGPAIDLQNLLTQERMSPTGLVKELGPSLFQPAMRHLREAVQAILGANDEATVDLCIFSVVSQCRALLPANRRYSRAVPARPSKAKLDAIARHITTFSIGGFEATRTNAARASACPAGAASP